MAKPRKPESAEAVQPNLPATEAIQDRIRLRAYEIYEARNGAPGDAEGDWYQAEAEIVGKQVAKTSE